MQRSQHEGPVPTSTFSGMLCDSNSNCNSGSNSNRTAAGLGQQQATTAHTSINPTAPTQDMAKTNLQPPPLAQPP